MTKGIFVIFGQDSGKVRPLFSPLLWNADVSDFFQGQITCSLSFNTICLNVTFWWTGTETIRCMQLSILKIEICSFDQGCLKCCRVNLRMNFWLAFWEIWRHQKLILRLTDLARNRVLSEMIQKHNFTNKEIQYTEKKLEVGQKGRKVMKICRNYMHCIACCRLSNHLWRTYRPPLGCVYPSRHFPIYDEKMVLNFPLRQCQFGYGVSSLMGQK